jgi:dTDP-4-dehydrorhamnose 3,5-epimerase
MEFSPCEIFGAFLIKPKKIADERGYFARAWCEREFLDHDLKVKIKQSNMAATKFRGTLRGLHYQTAPHQEVKVLRCVRGEIFDVVVDLRADSPTHLKWQGFTLNPENAHAIYVPEGCATGYMTLADDSEIYYHTTAEFAPEHATGVRYDDPAFGIEWPTAPKSLSPQDAAWEYV